MGNSAHVMPTSVGVWFPKLCFVQGCVCILWFCLPRLDSSQMFPVSLGSRFYWHKEERKIQHTQDCREAFFFCRHRAAQILLYEQFYCLSSESSSMDSTSIKTKVGVLPRWAHRFSHINSHPNHKSIWILESYVSPGADWPLEFFLMDFYLRAKV